MKKLLLVITLVFIAAACSLDPDPKVDFQLTFIPVDSANMPAYVTPGRSHNITMYYRRPNDCYYVSEEPYYDINGNTRTVAVQAVLIEDANCQPLTSAEPEAKTFVFQCPATTEESFTFKFFKGSDAQGNQQYIEYIVPVQQ